MLKVSIQSEKKVIARDSIKEKYILKYCVYFKASVSSLSHYVNMSIQYTAIFHGCKIDNFIMKKSDFFLIFAQNIDCGYTLGPPQ